MPPTKPRPGHPVSPCVDICTLDEANNCVGCLRTVDEIIRWTTMSAEEQWQVVRDLESRRND